MANATDDPINAGLADDVPSGADAQVEAHLDVEAHAVAGGIEQSGEPADAERFDGEQADGEPTDTDSVSDAGGAAESGGPDLLEREGEAAADYLEGLLDIIDVDGDIDMDVDGDRAVVAIIGDHLRQLVGQGGSVLDALQELTRLAVARETGVRSRLMLDIAGYRARRRAELTKIGTQAAEKALASGESVALNPMSAFERKVVHDAVATAGLRSESEGVEPARYVVVLPTRRGAADAETPSAVVADSAHEADGAADLESQE